MDISKLSLDELHALNSKVVARIRVLNGRKQEDAAAKFAVGDQVYFTSKRGTRVTGEVTKVNRKSIKVQAQWETWKVSPSLLEHV